MDGNNKRWKRQLKDVYLKRNKDIQPSVQAAMIDKIYFNHFFKPNRARGRISHLVNKWTWSKQVTLLCILVMKELIKLWVFSPQAKNHNFIFYIFTNI